MNWHVISFILVSLSTSCHLGKHVQASYFARDVILFYELCGLICNDIWGLQKPSKPSKAYKRSDLKAFLSFGDFEPNLEVIECIRTLS